MPACKACGEWFAKTRDDMVLCSKCERALGRLAGYAEVVVRCKDCKYEFGGSCILCGFQSRKPDDFCSYGERKETE
nr:MAG TPA: RRN7 Zinc-finger of RNA-polymerase I-specific TFIIB, Rrn7 [Caudoviricetes sp.]